MQLTIQRLQHRLQIYEGPKTIVDEEILEVNQLEVVRVEETKDETLPYPRDLRD